MVVKQGANATAIGRELKQVSPIQLDIYAQLFYLGTKFQRL